MRAIRAACLTLALASGPALAADLELSFTVPGGGEPTALSLHDVGVGELPGITVRGADGRRHVLTGKVLGTSPEAWTVEFRIEALTEGKRGRTETRFVAHPTLITGPNQEASFELGAEVPVQATSDDGVAQITWENQLSYTVTFTPRT